jgi:hypothetical protein
LIATRKGDGYLHGPIKERSQYHNEKTDTYYERKTTDGRFMRGRKEDRYKGVSREN